MPFNPQNSLEQIKNISFPRQTGSAGEKKIQEYIKNSLSENGCEVQTQEIRFSTRFINIIAKLALLLQGILLLVSAIIAKNVPVLSIILCGIIVLLVICFTRWGRLVEHVFNIGKMQRSENIFVKKRSEREKKELVLLAHYDSKSQTLPLGLRLFSFIWFGTLSIAILTLIIISIIFEINLGDALIILSIVNLLILIPILINRSTNKSPGALDNASGVGILLEVARGIKDHRLKNSNVTILFTAAEEEGLIGAMRFVQKEKDNFDNENTLFLNLDGPGLDDNLIVTDKYALPPIRMIKTKMKILLDAAAELKLKIKKGYIPLGAGLDSIPISFHGFETATVACGRLCKSAFAVHSKNDVVENIELEGLRKVGNFVWKVIEIYDEKRRTPAD